MRSLSTFACAGDTLVGSLDAAPRENGLLIVSGGNEIRCGAHRGMALLAARIAEAGHPVFRFDRRGIGDSTGGNRGFAHSADDIAAAAARFRALTGVRRIVAFGNCDAATALALFHASAGIDALVLANPWTIDASDTLPPAAAIRARYAERLRDPQQWLRLVRGGVDIRKLFSGLMKVLRKSSEPPSDLANRLAAALHATAAPVTLLLARRDNTALAFLDAWGGPAFRPLHPRIEVAQRDTDSHSFASAEDKEWLFEQILRKLG